jgi:D-alanyl-D-alanine carboxypeptidase
MQRRPPYDARMDSRALDRSLVYVHSWLRWRFPRVDLTGCAIAVSLRGRLLFSQAYGYADASLGKALRPDDVFRVASHSKSFTATAILQLTERGALGLDDPIARHLGWLASHRDPRMNTVTLRHLLYHGAGIFRDGLDADFWQLGRPFPDASELEKEVLAADLVFDPNLSMKYSNVGYGLLGLVIEAVSGRTYAEYLDECVIGPLHLSATAADLVPGLRDRAVRGHGRREPDGARLAIPEVGTGALAAATGVASTAPDLCTFFSALLPGSRKLLSDESKREMQRVHFRVHRPFAGDEDYGLGLSLLRVGERRTFGHSGGFPGQVSRTIADPTDGIVVSVLVNCSDGPATEVAKGVVNVIDFFQEHASAPVPRSLRRLEGRYVSLFGAIDLVATGETMAAGDPNTWDPFAEASRLERSGPGKLCIADQSSYGAPGEHVRFHTEGGTVATASWAGMTLWPEHAWPGAKRELLRADYREQLTRLTSEAAKPGARE